MGKLKRFLEVLDEYDEGYLTSGDEARDLEQIVSAIQVQGYFAGDRYRFYFDNDFNLIKVEERKFGK